MSAFVSASFGAVTFGGGISTSCFLYALLIHRDSIEETDLIDDVILSRSCCNSQPLLPLFDQSDACSFLPPIMDLWSVVTWLTCDCELSLDTYPGTLDLSLVLISQAFRFLLS